MEEKEPEYSAWHLEKLSAEFCDSRQDYICKIKITGPKKLARQDNLTHCLKHLLFPLSQDFIFFFDLESFLSTCENLDSFLGGSRNPIQTLQAGMTYILRECLARDDVTGSMIFGNYFKLGEGLSKVSLLPLKQVLCSESRVAEEEMVIRSVRFDSASGVLLLTSQLNGFLANFGRIWSIIEEVPLTCVEVLKLKVDPDFSKVELKNLLTFRSEELIVSANLVVEDPEEAKRVKEKADDYKKEEDSGENKENSFDMNESILGEWHVE